MDVNSSGEELVIKTRKPYTITKQRERWTEEEHNRFLEALRLYGRAWQKIEEHIGTKTAVQIRSHAQKFFSKLEKEAHAKGIPVGQALDIDIPPPRPKRKPSNPYPRKTGTGSPTSHAVAKDGKPATSVSSLHCKEAHELGDGSLSEKLDEESQPSKPRENQGDNHSDCFAHFQEARCHTVSSADRISLQTAALSNSCTFREFLPSREQAGRDSGSEKASNPEKYCDLHATSVQGSVRDSGNGISSISEKEPHTYPRHVPVHVVDGSSITRGLSSPPTMPSHDSLIHLMEETHGCSNSFIDPSASAARSEHHDDTPRSPHQTLPAFHPAVGPVPQTPEDYQSFANLIMSTLLQNPAVHAAATFTASFWPHQSAGSPTCTQRGLNSPPSVAAIAAATVAAATAWWATHGLLPLCAPFHSAFPCYPPSTTSVPSGNIGQASAAKLDRKEMTLRKTSMQNQELDTKHPDASRAQRLASKSTLSPSDSEESESTKLKTGPKPVHREEPAAKTDPHGSNETKNRKQVDRSSSGSNTPSSSDVEVDASEKHEKGQDEVKEVDTDANPSANESSTRRSRSSNNLYESWKAVSEEGRMAFEALFSRKVLPQSFSPPHDMKNNGNQKANTVEEKKSTNTEEGDALVLDLNSNAQAAASDRQGEKRNASLNCGNTDQEGFLAIGLGTAKLKGRKTGFKPYKRCSMEAKESRIISTSSVTQVEQKDPKRIRLESEAST